MSYLTFSLYTGFSLCSDNWGSDRPGNHCNITLGGVIVKILYEDKDDGDYLSKNELRLDLHFREWVGQFDSVAIDLINLYPSAVFVVVGQSLKFLKWSLKYHFDQKVAAITVSEVKSKYTATEEFTKYLRRKIQKVCFEENMSAPIVVLDYSNEGETLRQIKSDILSIGYSNVTSYAFYSSDSLIAKIDAGGGIDQKKALPPSIASLVANQEFKGMVGRNKEKVSYKDWTENAKEARSATADRYKSFKTAYTPKLEPDEKEIIKTLKCVHEYIRTKGEEADY